MKGTGLGLSSVILAVCGIFVPMGFLLSGISGALALSSYKYRDSYAVAALILNIANLTVLSPVTLITVLSSRPELLQGSIDKEIRLIYGIIFTIQIIGLRLHSKRKVEREIINKSDESKKERIEPKL
ncbi:hypothetical protein [Vibrio tapetis]|uniref:Uncharacterized protein n=1 Tax=Vibrio tapetis subsp. tapetis TaxID=1671868 RepID=A0A2N8Z9Q3_9VIBR|nr:hypothetical protein [Vibrio tapetis]SON48612.1 membrane protein of unknown function [Vibrio tapetis subsp. tapetis]